MRIKNIIVASTIALAALTLASCAEKKAPIAEDSPVLQSDTAVPDDKADPEAPETPERATEHNDDEQPNSHSWKRHR